MHERIRERPVLFSAPMVKALLAGTKTQTRRVMKDQFEIPAFPPTLRLDANEQFSAFWGIHARRCPYGAPGDRLWVREKLYLHRHAGDRGGWLYAADNAHVTVKATDDDALLAMRVWAHHVERDYCVSIHMPRWASRITLEVTEVRVQRLQDISEEDCIAEGIEPKYIDAAHRQRWRMYEHTDGRGGPENEVVTYVGPSHTMHPHESYKSLWLSINGPGSWDANPYVWAVSFRKVAP